MSSFQLPFRLNRNSRRRSSSEVQEESGQLDPVAVEPDHSDWQNDIHGVEVVHAEFTTTTADGAEHAAHEALAPLLARVREAYGLDVVFVAELLNQVPVVRQRKPGGAPPQAEPGEVEHGALMLALRGDGDLSRRDYLTCPVVAPSGRTFGSVCCRAQTTSQGTDAAETLQAVARMLAEVLDRSPASPLPEVWDSRASMVLG